MKQKQTFSISMGRRWSLFIAATAVALANVASAQISPEAQALVDQYNEATGGLEAKKSIKTLIQTGTWEMPEQGTSGATVTYIEHPKRMVSIIEIPDVGEVRVCLDDGVAWETNAITGFRYLEGTELQQSKKDSVLFPEIHIAELYSKATLMEPRSDGLIPVQFIDMDGFEETWFFDPITHYIAEIQRVLDAGVRGSYNIKVKFSNYLPSGDLIVAHKIESSTPAFKIINTVEKCDINAEIPDYLFMKPEGN